MVFRAQDANGIVDLDHLVVLISTTTTDIDRERVLIDNLWGPISDLRRHEFHRKVSEGVSGGILNSAIISLVASPRKDRSHSRCSPQML